MYLNMIIENLTKGYSSVYENLIPLITISLGIFVIIAKNPVVSVLHLICLFIAISLFLMSIGLYFIGLSYILVYVGAISILFLFILMLINIRVSELSTEGKNSIPLAIMSILFISFSINSIIPQSNSFLDTSEVRRQEWPTIAVKNMSNEGHKVSDYDIINLKYIYHLLEKALANISSKYWDGNLLENTHITSIGNILYSNLFILIIIISLVLLLAMVGCIMLTVKE